MAGRTGEITEDIKAIARTRAEISEKVEALQCGISATVEHTKAGVQEVIQQARDTTVDFAQQTKWTFAQQTKRTLDPVYQGTQHPWFMVGAAIALGYVLGARAEEGGRRSRAAGHRGRWSVPRYGRH